MRHLDMPEMPRVEDMSPYSKPLLVTRANIGLLPDRPFVYVHVALHNGHYVPYYVGRAKTRNRFYAYAQAIFTSRPPAPRLIYQALSQLPAEACYVTFSLTEDPAWTEQSLISKLHALGCPLVNRQLAPDGPGMAEKNFELLMGMFPGKTRLPTKTPLTEKRLLTDTLLAKKGKRPRVVYYLRQ